MIEGAYFGKIEIEKLKFPIKKLEKPFRDNSPR